MRSADTENAAAGLGATIPSCSFALLPRDATDPGAFIALLLAPPLWLVCVAVVTPAAYASNTTQKASGDSASTANAHSACATISRATDAAASEK